MWEVEGALHPPHALAPLLTAKELCPTGVSGSHLRYTGQVVSETECDFMDPDFCKKLHTY